MRFVVAAIASGLLLVFGATSLSAYPLTLDQRKRFKRYLPRSFAKLEARDPVHVVVLGDSVTGGYTPLDSAWENNNPLYSYAGSFLTQLAREFFYPGGAHLLNPPEGGTGKLTDYLGDEITFENLTVTNGTALTGLRRSSTDAFLHDPDLMVIQYGVYDAFGRIGIDVYQRALQELIDSGKSQKVDMILLAPGIANRGSGAMNWGLTRPYAMAASEIAEANGVMFMDAGQHLARFGGGVDSDTDPAAAMEIVGDRMSRIFDYGHQLEEPEVFHTSTRANEYLAQSLFDELKNGPRHSKFSYAGVAAFDREGEVNVTVAVRNLTKDDQQGCIGALSVGDGLIPVQATQRYTVAAEGVTQLGFTYRRPSTGKARDGSDVLFPLQPSDEFCRFSFVLEDTVGSELINLPLRIGPITAIWKSRQFLNVSDRIRIEWDLVNGTDKASSGTFQVGMGDKVGESTNFSVSALGTKTVFSLFDFSAPAGHTPFQRDIWIQTEVNKTIVRFNRELEASRDIVLGEDMPLRRWSGYADAPPPASESTAQRRPEGSARVRFDADEDALYLSATLQGITIPDLGDEAALRARIFLDARPVNEVLSFGVVEPLEIFAKGMDGPGSAPALPLGCFGNGYNMRLAPKGVTSALTTDSSGDRVLEVRIPRTYLHRHEWNLGSIDSLLGVKVELTIADASGEVGAFLPENSFVSHSPTWAYENQAIYSFNEKDARSLSVLRLSRQPVQSWSVRIY